MRQMGDFIRNAQFIFFAFKHARHGRTGHRVCESNQRFDLHLTSLPGEWVGSVSSVLP